MSREGNPLPSFADRCVLVTGGGTGIGQAIAAAFARAGASVVVAGRTRSTLDGTVRLIEAAGGAAAAFVADVRRAEDVAGMVDFAASAFGGLHIAVNNAGIAAPALTADIAEDDWNDVIGVNLTGAWLCMKYEIAYLLTQGGGEIVNVGSILGRHASVAGMASYSASKAGLAALTRTAAREYVRQGIRINSVSPGPIETLSSPVPAGEPVAPEDSLETQIDKHLMEAIAAGRAGTPEEVAAAVLWLASPAASLAVGLDLVLDGGSVA